MKKFIVILTLLAIVLCSACVFVACNEKEEETATIASWKARMADSVTIHVGDEFSADDFVFTAVLTDKTKVEATNKEGFTYNTEDLHLEDGKYSQTGEYVLHVTYLDKYTFDYTVIVNEAEQ